MRSERGQTIHAFAPDGEILEEHSTPDDPTNCCFGGPDLSDLYVTGFSRSLHRARTQRVGLVHG